jgi:hypothetical protein
MRESLQVIDGFLPAGVAAAARREALDLDFSDKVYKGERYPKVAFLPHEWTVILAGQLELAVRARVRVRLSFVRVSGAGDDTPQWIHADDGEAAYAAVFYLSEPHGEGEEGTAFWRHREYGADEINPAGESAAWVERLNRDGHDDEAWERVGFAAQRFNRLLWYPTRLFHSRFPKESPGDSFASSRMIWAAFFDVVT